MSYIGSTPTTQSFIAGTDYFNGNGSTTAFTLSRPVVSVNDIQAVVNNVVQVPNDAYNVSGNTITFTSAPSSGTGNVYVRYLSTTTQSITPSQNTVSYATWDNDLRSETFAFKNRIINGDMTIDQRNAGAAVTVNDSGPYTLDRWFGEDVTDGVFTVQQDSSAPAGFNFSAKITVTTADSSLAAGQYAVFTQRIEGFNTADLAWGTANAQTVTLSFWVRSSLTGTFGGVIANSAENYSYPFTYTINSANTWEQKTVTIVGPTAGTWVGATNGKGMVVTFGLGSGSTYVGTAGAWAAADYRGGATGQTNVMGTLNATWYVTGVQLEKGTTATNFDVLPFGTKLQLCQRYYERSYNYGVATGTGLADGWYGFAAPTTSTECNALITFKVPKRVSPTMVVYNAISGASGASYRVSDAVSVGTTLARIGQNNVGVAYTATGNVNTYYYHWTASSEL